MKNLEAKRIYERMIQLYEEFTKSETYNRGSILGEFIEKSKQLCAIKADAEFESADEHILILNTPSAQLIKELVKELVTELIKEQPVVRTNENKYKYYGGNNKPKRY